jgi:hypothetical protein
MPKPSARSIIEEMLRNNPSLATASDDEFIQAVRNEALAKGYKSDLTPWYLLRQRYAIKAKIAGRTTQRLSKEVLNLIKKARQSALEAVATYNNPMSPFRSGSFIIHMHIAWNALLLAVFLRRGVKPHYIDQKTGRPELVDGEVKWWELSKCAKEYWKGGEYAVSKNIEFFVGIRNKIEHSLMPELDLDIFGECQAYLINFENIFTREFGARYALTETLAMSLQFSRLRDVNQNQAVRKLHEGLRSDIKEYIDRFRSALSAEISNNMEFSFKVFLVPNTGNHRSKESLAVEFVRYDSLEPDEAEKFERIVTLIKEKQIPVANLDKMRAGQVAKQVEDAIKPRKFTASNHHARCVYFYKIRPPKGSPNPAACDNRYCFYDAAHNDYVYTKAWVDLLVKEMSDPAKYESVMKDASCFMSAGKNSKNGRPHQKKP